jgi:thiol-disulfide isomerase/thioredoxin
MKLRLLSLCALLAAIIPLPASAFNFVPTDPKPAAEITFLDADGKQRTLDEFRGQVVVLNLWATWCAPCRKEMPSLDRLQAEHGGDSLEVVALSVDRGDLDKVVAFYEEIGVAHLAIYRDPKAQVPRDLRAPGLPTTVVIDRAGQDVGRVLGPAEWDSDEAIAVLQALMAP